MSFVTDRKRATPTGSARQGTERAAFMTLTAKAMIVLVPLFIFTIGPALGRPYEEVQAYFARPFPALVTALMVWVAFMHFKTGMRMVLEDYVHGYARELSINIMTIIAYGLAATGVFAVLKMAI